MCLLFFPVFASQYRLNIACVAQFCKAEKGFPETPAGELEAIECPDKLFRDVYMIPQWGYIAKLCSPSQNPIWIDVADICTPVRKLVNPPYGSFMMDYEVEVCFQFSASNAKITNFNSTTFLTRHKFLMDNALFNKTIEYVVKPIDVIVTDVKTGNKDGQQTAILTIHQRVDTYYRNVVIQLVKDIFTNGEVLEMLQEYDDEFIGVGLCSIALTNSAS